MSTLFNLRPPVKETPKTTHPWDKTLNNKYCNEKKYAHNSIKNPHYPEKKKNKPDEDIVKFSIIGDRLTKEFIYCVNLVSGLHKYKWKKFDVPEIRGVTSVEWSEIWRSLKIKYGGLAYCIQSRVAVLMNDNFLGGENELKDLIESKYIYHLQLDYCNEAISNFATYIRCSGKSCAYMHVSINQKPIGTLIFMLYSDLLPYTCDNFLRLCNERKGGYSGTSVHRIVKDGWIQCGGFGLKSTDLGCENFMVPHDRRGVLCMANDGRHVDCSTQFFILLQPAPWMAHKYVAFGQLIEGEKTLDKIEEQPTWYESPTTEITIYKSGILNLECDDITVNKGTNEYIYGHIEDLFALGESLIEILIQRVFLETELRLVQRLQREMMVEEEETVNMLDGDVHRTRRFIRKRETREGENMTRKESQAVRSQSIKSAATSKVVPDPSPRKDSDQENNDFDVEEYELEGSVYQHMSIVTESLVVKPEKHYYIPLTDIQYPGEKDSTFDLKKFLTGEYCLESDLDPKAPKKPHHISQFEYPSEVIQLPYDVSETASSESLNSEEEREVREYLRAYSDRTSFAGGIVKSIARGNANGNLFTPPAKLVQITEDQLRRVRMATADHRVSAREHDAKVKIDIPHEHSHHRKIKRRQTGFVHRKILEKTESELALEEEEAVDAARTVRISASATAPSSSPLEPRAFSARRPTGFIRMMEIDNDDDDDESEVDLTDREMMDRDQRDSHRPSALQRLYEETRMDYDSEPTLKSYRSHPSSSIKPTLLTVSPNCIKREDSDMQKVVLRKPKSASSQLYDNAMELQHNKKLVRKISSDYVKTFHPDKFENSIRSIEFAKTRPALTVSAYQMKNLIYQEELKKQNQKIEPIVSLPAIPTKGIRLPGDSPCYSFVELPPSSPSPASTVPSIETNDVQE